MTALFMVLWITGTVSAAAAGFQLLEPVMDWCYDHGHDGAALIGAYAVGLGPPLIWNIALLAVVAP